MNRKRGGIQCNNLKTDETEFRTISHTTSIGLKQDVEEKLTSSEEKLKIEKIESKIWSQIILDLQNKTENLQETKH